MIPIPERQANGGKVSHSNLNEWGAFGIIIYFYCLPENCIQGSDYACY